MHRILFVNLEGRVGGAEKSLLLLLKHLKNYYNIILSCPGSSELAQRAVSMHINCHDLPIQPRKRYISILGIASWFKTTYTLMRITRKTKPDIVHANNLPATTMSILPAALIGCHLVSHARDFPKHPFFERVCGRFCKRIISVSTAVNNRLVEHGLNGRKMCIIHNAFSDESSEDDSVINKGLSPTTPIGKQAFCFANVGQFVRWKKQKLFVEAAIRTARKLPDVRFTIIGDDILKRNCRYKKELLAMVACSEIADIISMTGWSRNMDQVWGSVDCLVHTSDKEPFGRVIVEAMAHKVPVIAADCCGPKEIIENNKTGILLPSNDVDALSKAMVSLASNAKLAKGLAQAGYRHVMSNFTSDTIAQKTRQVYEDILAC